MKLRKVEANVSRARTTALRVVLAAHAMRPDQDRRRTQYGDFDLPCIHGHSGRRRDGHLQSGLLMAIVSDRACARSQPSRE